MGDQGAGLEHVTCYILYMGVTCNMLQRVNLSFKDFWIYSNKDVYFYWRAVIHHIEEYVFSDKLTCAPSVSVSKSRLTRRGIPLSLYGPRYRYPSLFTVSKPKVDICPIGDLRALNIFIQAQKFSVKSTRSSPSCTNETFWLLRRSWMHTYMS